MHHGEPTRHEVPERHPIFGDGWLKLKDEEVIKEGDQRQHISMLFSLTSGKDGRWRPVLADEIGKTVATVCADKEDCDAWELIFRRRANT